MPKYRLRPFGNLTDKEDLTLEIENHRARIYNDEKVYHDWGYTDCLDYVHPPGTVNNDHNFGILIGSRIHLFGMSEAAAAALQKFWERGVLLRNPNSGRDSVRAGLWSLAIGGVIVSAAV